MLLGEFGGRNYSFTAEANVNDGRFVDIQLQVQATGWVAIGFSATSMMVNNAPSVVTIMQN